MLSFHEWHILHHQNGMAARYVYKNITIDNVEFFMILL